MTFDDVRAFLEEHHEGVAVTFRRSGAAQASMVVCGLQDGGVAFTTRGEAAKLANLKRDPRCTMLVSAPDRSRYVVLEGAADILASDRTEAEELRLALRQTYRACSGHDHTDWDEYDQAMKDQRRAVIIVKPRHVYGFTR